LSFAGYAYTACESGINNRLSEVCQELYTGSYATSTTAQLNAVLGGNGCPTLAAGRGRGWVPASPAELAQRAAASFELPDPSGHRSPLETLRYDGYAFTYVNLPTFFWTDANTWRSFTATARAGGNWATVTARPVALMFDPGDGSAPVTCNGPGRAWEESDGNAAPTDGVACTYAYSRVTDAPITSTQTIRWQLTWDGSGQTSGALTSRSTSQSGQLNVLQIQVVNR
jgi:hypothetical protein